MKRKLISTRRGYVYRLRLMLARESCECCPACKDFDARNTPMSQRQVCGTTFLRDWCTSFIGLSPLSKTGEKCPCERLGKKALARAHLAIEAWDAGKHPWQKESE